MDTVLWLVLGVVAGLLAMFVIYRKFPSSPMQWIGAIVVGLIGGWVGGWVTDLIGLEAVNWLGSLVVAFLGALLLLILLRRLSPGT